MNIMHETAKVLVNPFKKGDKVTVPAGSQFTTTNPKVHGTQVTKRKVVNEVELDFKSYAKYRMVGRGSVVSVSPPSIYCAGSGSYWKDIVVTEEMILLNGKTVEYAEVRVY
jgi:hypothetical protein